VLSAQQLQQLETQRERSVQQQMQLQQLQQQLRLQQQQYQMATNGEGLATG